MSTTLNEGWPQNKNNRLRCHHKTLHTSFQSSRTTFNQAASMSTTGKPTPLGIGNAVQGGLLCTVKICVAVVVVFSVLLFPTLPAQTPAVSHHSRCVWLCGTLVSEPCQLLHCIKHNVDFHVFCGWVLVGSPHCLSHPSQCCFLKQKKKQHMAAGRPAQRMICSVAACVPIASWKSQNDLSALHRHYTACL